MKRTAKLLFIAASFALTICSCAVETDESNTDIAKKVFNSWLRENHLDHIKPTDVGIYIIGDSAGSGDKVRDSSYIFINLVQKGLDGSISSHNSEELAIQLGSWTVKSRFTPTVWYTASLGYGLRDMLIGHDISDNVGQGGMLIGGRRNAIIVPWVKNPDTGEEVSSSSTTSYIYDIEVIGQTPDIIKYQVDSLENFKAHYPGGILKDVDSTYYGMYFQLAQTSEECDTITDGTSISLWYIGKYLDGTVFDTNIKDTAKFYRIYDASSSYTTLSFTFYRDSSEAVNGNSTVKGFTHAVRTMRRYGDKCRTFFTSDFGYGSSGSGNIPGYEPLYFDIWIKEK